MKRVIIVLCFLLASNIVIAQNWQLKKEGDGLKVYTAETPGSPYKSVRVECSATGRPSQVVAVMLDLERQKEWVFNDKYSKLLKQVAPNELIYYSEVSVPWPGTNRDFISHMTIAQPSVNVVTIESHAQPDFLPEKDGLIRLQKSNSHWTITNMGSNRLDMVYEIQFDPAGSVPAWIINMFITKGPYETFRKLQERVGLPYYKDAHYEFIKE